jgi:hypothetical protein
MFGGGMLTAGYHPGVYMPARKMLRDHGKIFTWYDVEDMRADATVDLGLKILRAPMAGAKREVKCNNPAVAQFVEDQFKRIWQHDLDKILTILEYGTAGGEVGYRQTQAGWEVDRLADMHIADLQPVTRKNIVESVEVRNIKGKGGDKGGEVALPSPRFWWVANQPRFGSVWGRSYLQAAWEPWQEKTAQKGARDARRTWYFKNAYRGGTIRHPNGILDLGDGITRSCADYARELMEKFETGGILVLPNAVDEKGNYTWTFEPPAVNGDLGDIRDYVKDLNEEIHNGMGILSEVVKASESGSGWSGRSVPMMVFLASLDAIVSHIVEAIDRQIIRWLVRVNFGAVDYTVTAVSLVPKDPAPGSEPGKPPQPGGQPQPPNPQPTPQPAANPIQLSAAHAPKGGVTIQGVQYTGGQFIPAEVLAKATPEERAKIAGNTDGDGDADAKASKILSMAKGGLSRLGKAGAAIKAKATGTYQKLESRYGRATALAIMAAGIAGLPIPIPGTSFLAAAPIIAMAEVYRYAKGSAA